MQTPIQAAAENHATLLADIQDVTDYLHAALIEAPQLRCNGTVHIEMAGHTSFEDGSAPYVLFVVSRAGIDRFYKAYMRIEPAELSPSITMAPKDPRHQHGG